MSHHKQSTGGLNRTYYPKHVSYNGDGAGRDNYVIFNHQGLGASRDFSGSIGGGGIKRGSMVGSMARKDERPVDYIPDGTGRDTYII